MKVGEFYFLDIGERRLFLEDFFSIEKLNYETQAFEQNNYNGTNFLILDWFRQNKTNIVITAHYDGFGAYDNAGGTIGLLWLLKWAKFDKLAAFKNRFGLVVSFTDGEEVDLAGVRCLLRHRIFQSQQKYNHIALDGFGIGTCIGGFANRRNVIVKLPSTGKRSLPLQAETNIFQDIGIPSLHLFTLPKDQLINLVARSLFPPCWQAIHTEKDTPDKIDEEMLPFVILSLYRKMLSLDFEESEVFMLK
jgi:hypothetical protein